MQKRATSIYLGKRKGDWEKEKILKARTNSKILWDYTRDISGKTKKKDEEAYIYIDGEKKSHRSGMENVYRNMEKRDIPESTQDGLNLLVRNRRRNRIKRNNEKRRGRK